MEYLLRVHWLPVAVSYLEAVDRRKNFKRLCVLYPKDFKAPESARRQMRDRRLWEVAGTVSQS
jgi:hypothetical protein